MLEVPVTFTGALRLARLETARVPPVIVRTEPATVPVSTTVPLPVLLLSPYPPCIGKVRAQRSRIREIEGDRATVREGQYVERSPTPPAPTMSWLPAAMVIEVAVTVAPFWIVRVLVTSDSESGAKAIAPTTSNVEVGPLTKTVAETSPVGSSKSAEVTAPCFRI